MSYFYIFNLNVLLLYILKGQSEYSTIWPNQFVRVDMLMRGTRTHAQYRVSATAADSRAHRKTEEQP